MHKFYYFFLLLMLPLISGFAQTPAQRVEIQSLIDQPTAGSLEKGEYGFDVRFFPDGGTLVGMQAGMFSRFMIGVSYGGVNIIGNGQPEWNELPGVLVKYRMFEESDFPALSIGFDSQGYGMYYDFAKRYEYKAKGLFAVISKNYSIGYLGFLGIHGGVNYNTFENDDDRNVTGFIGLDKSLNDQISVLAEYNLGFDDDAVGALGRDRGYLNAGLRWVFGGQLGIEFNFKDILRNRRDINAISRELRLTYVETL